MEEEKQSEHQDENAVERRISYDLLPKPEERMRAASIADVSIKSEVKDELASLFS